MIKKLISIVMPVKNAELYLEESIESILQQTENHWELLAINDHSTDNSYQILKHYSEKDSRIKVSHNKGEGIIKALQTAYRLSEGEFIHRMDADDIMPDRKLKTLKNILIEHGRGHLATGLVKYFSKEGISDGYLKYEHWLNNLCANNNHWNEIYKECVIPSPCWLVYREDFEKCGGFESDIYPEDYDLTFRFYKHQLKIISSNEILHLWRDHSERISRNHIHYQQNAFFEIKLHYFLQLEREPKRPLVIWGAGKKGKIMAKLLQKRQEEFTWVSNNPNKKGKEIYDQLMHSFESILSINRPQVIVTVAQRDSKDEIVAFLEGKGLKPFKDYWFFR